MGPPFSGRIAEMFLYVEHSHITNLTQKHGIVNYCSYVDILIMFDPNHSHIQKILNDFNSLHPKLRFTAERRLHEKLLRPINTQNTHRPENRYLQKTHIQTPSYRSSPTTLYNTNMPPSDTCETGSNPTTYRKGNINKN